MSFFKKYRWPILSGILIGTSYIPFPPWAAIFAFVPLWLWWSEQTSWKAVFWGGWVTQFVLTIIGFNWVAHTVHEFGHLPWPLAIITLGLFACFASLHIPLAGLFWWWTGRRPFALAGSLILVEMAYPMIFDWHLGYTVAYAGLPAQHLAEWIGVRGLDSLIILSNLFVLQIWQNRKQLSLAKFSSIALVLLLVGSQAIGIYLRSRLTPPDSLAQIQLVQANIGNLEKQEAERGNQFREYIMAQYFNITKAGLAERKPDLTVWPETAMPLFLNEPYLSTQDHPLQFVSFVKENQLNIVTGGYGIRGLQRELLNSLYTFNSSGASVGTPYSKTVLLAFGEYFPGADWFPILRKWLPEVGQFGRGAGPSIVSLNNITLGPLICYEGIIESFARDVGLLNPQMLVNITNDSWYGKWQQPKQHLYMTMARSIEQRRPVIRSTNTGFSTIALASGEILELSPLHEPWQAIYQVPYLKEPKHTFYMSFGYYFSLALALILYILSFINCPKWLLANFKIVC